MKQEEFNPVLFEEAYDQLLDRYAETCPTAKRPQTSAQKRANQAGQMQNKAPKPPTPARPRIDKPAPQKRKCPNTAASSMQFSEAVAELKKRIGKTDGSYKSIDKEMRALAKAKGITPEELHKQFKAKEGMVPDDWYEQNFSEYDFAAKTGRGKPCGNSHISAAYECRLGAEERKGIVNSLVKAGGTKEKIDGLNDEQLSRVAKLVKERGLDVGGAQQASSAVDKLKGEKAGGKKQGGANLQDPETAGKYADFYEAKKDLSYKAPYNTDPKVAKAALDQLKDEDPAAYTKTMSALSGKGSPSQEQLAKAGWESRSERGEAVLKSLMDNDFKDVHGQEASWRQGLQLDHKKAGSVGGGDRPENWIWISTASNQAKGGMEAAAQKRGLKGQEAENYIRNGLIEKLRKNQRMSAQDVAAAKGAGSAKAANKKAMEAAMRDNLPLMTPAQRGRRINDASGDEIKTMLKASVNSEKNPVTGRAASYRPVLTGGGAERVRKAYGTVPEMKSLMRLRWGQDLDSTDLRNIGGMLRKSTGSKKPMGDRLDELLGNFPPTTGLTAAQRIEILAE